MTNNEPEPVIWGIHAGDIHNADRLFLKKNIIAIGWYEMGDLSKIAPTREAFKEKIAESIPNVKPGQIPNWAGQTFRFVHEMKEGDIVVYPSKSDRKINIGKIAGPYQYDISLINQYPNIRSVKWLHSLPRTHFKQGALYEIGSAMTLFQIKNFADEITNVLVAKGKTPVEKDDETIKYVAEEIERNTKDFILKKLSTELKGHPLEEFVAHLLKIMGYQTRLTPVGADGGIDIIAHKDELGFEPPIIKVQVKSTEGSVGDPVVSALYGKVDQDEYGLLVTLGIFSNQAKNFARNKSNLRLIDGEELVGLISKHYEAFDSRYKGIIPLKKIYVPESLEDGS